MRVKLSYTVELEKVPEKLEGFLEEAVRDLSLSASHLQKVKMDLLPMEVLNTIDEVRQSLALIDSRLEDCYVAYAGYHRMMLEDHLPVEEQHPHLQNMQMPDGTQTPDPAEMEQIQQSLQMLRESTAHLKQGVGDVGEPDEQS